MSRWSWFFLGSIACAGEATTPGTPGGEGLGEVTWGECDTTGTYRSALPLISAEVDDQGRMVVVLEDTPATCCPSPVGDFQVDGDAVLLDFATETTSPCDCMCVFDFTATSEPFPAGSYTLAVEVDGTFVADLDLTVL